MKVPNLHAKSLQRKISDTNKYQNSIRRLNYQLSSSSSKTSASVRFSSPVQQEPVRLHDKLYRGWLTDLAKKLFSDTITSIRTKINLALLSTFTICLRSAHCQRQCCAVEVSIRTIAEYWQLLSYIFLQ